jgi:hypothetical protein
MDMAIAQLNTGVSSNSLAELFDFPEDVKTACTQYLQYFYEFLKDVGIKAKVAVTEQDSGEVLFSVIPDDKDAALENIREALNIYLRLPNSQIDADMSDLTVQSLNAQIFHLKGQLDSGSGHDTTAAINHTKLAAQVHIPRRIGSLSAR